MDTFYINILASYSVGIAAIIGLYRYKNIIPDFRPFIILLWVALTNEIVSFIFMKVFKSNAFNSGIYIVIEYIVIMWQFKNWQSFKSNKVFKIMLALGILIWVIDNLVINSLYTFNSIFRTLYSCVIVFLSIQQISTVLIFERGNILKNAKFIICCAFLIYYSFKSFIEVFYVFHLNMPWSFYHTIYFILVLTNFVSNLIFALATLWIPNKRRFSVPY